MLRHTGQAVEVAEKAFEYNWHFSAVVCQLQKPLPVANLCVLGLLEEARGKSLFVCKQGRRILLPGETYS